MTSNRSAIISLLVFGVSSQACAPALVDESPVARVTPKIAPSPKPATEGMGRVVLDVEGEHARVSRISERVVPVGQGTVLEAYRGDNDIYTMVGHEETKEVCKATPCAVDLPLGSSELLFETEHGGRDTAFVNASPTPTVARHRIGTYRKESKERAMAAGGLIGVGALGLLIGPVALIGGNAEDPSKSGQTRLIGGIATAAGAALVLAGVWLYSTAVEKRTAGPTIQWSAR